MEWDEEDFCTSSKGEAGKWDDADDGECVICFGRMVTATVSGAAIRTTRRC